MGTQPRVVSCRRGRPGSLAPLVLLALACATSGPGVPLERVYRPGAPKDTALVRAENQENMWAYARPLTGDAGRDLLPAGAAEALGPEKLARATGYDAYDARLRHVSGYTVRWERFCDVIFHDAEDRIVGVMRRPGRCLQLPR